MSCKVCEITGSKDYTLASTKTNPFRKDKPLLSLDAKILKTMNEETWKSEKRLFLVVNEDYLKEVEYMPKYCPECGRKLGTY